jgi:hypothetical protein
MDVVLKMGIDGWKTDGTGMFSFIYLFISQWLSFLDQMIDF